MRRWLACSLGMLGVADAALNQIARETARLSAPAPQNFDGFGIALASSHTHLIVGSPGFANVPALFGAVHVYEYQASGNPVLVQSIPGPQDSLDRRFGVSLAMGVDFLAVGSFNPFDREDNPRAVVDIHRSNHPTPGAWGRVARIQTSTPFLYHGDQTISVASNGPELLVGFPAMEKVMVIGSGTVGPDDWQVMQEIVAPDPEFFDNFGTSMEADGTWLAIGAPYENQAGDNKGAVYLYNKVGTQWIYTQKLIPPKTSAGYNFGRHIRLSGEWMAAGNNNGGVFIYRRDAGGQWSWFQTLGEPFFDYKSFDLEGSELLCGFPNNSSGATASGRGDLYGFDAAAGTWQKRAELRPFQPTTYGLVGGATLITGRGYLLGSGYRDMGISGSSVPPGSCHLFERPALESYAAWVQRTFPLEHHETPAAEPGAVVNKLGLTNWMSYAMGLDPFSPEPSRLPRMEFDPADQRWGFRFQVRPNAADFSWRAITSGNLQSWSIFNGSANLVSYGTEVQKHFPKLSPASGTRQFFRLEITPLAP